MLVLNLSCPKYQADLNLLKRYQTICMKTISWLDNLITTFYSDLKFIAMTLRANIKLLFISPMDFLQFGGLDVAFLPSK